MILNLKELGYIERYRICFGMYPIASWGYQPVGLRCEIKQREIFNWVSLEMLMRQVKDGGEAFGEDNAISN